jgi:hypothetical protein
MTSPNWRTPTLDEARWFAQGLELQVHPEMVLMAIDPTIPEDAVPTLATKWLGHTYVRAARFDLREWMAKSGKDRMIQASERAYNGMCWFLMQENVAHLQDAKLAKALKFLEAIEKKLAGTSGTVDMATKFWEEFQAKKKGGPESKVGLGSLQ